MPPAARVTRPVLAAPPRRAARRAMLAGLLLALAGCQSSQERAAQAGAEAQQLFDNRQYREAALVLQRAIRARDDVPELWVLLGRTQLALRQYGGAYAAYSNALDLERSNREALAILAQLSLNTGDFAAATRYASQIQSLDPADVLSQVVLGFVAIGQQRYEVATGIAATLLAQDPANAPARVMQSMVRQRNGDSAGALAVLQPVAGQTTPDVLRQLRSLYRQTADPRGLLSVLERETRAAPANLPLQAFLVQQLYMLGRDGDAARRLQALFARAAGDELRAETIALWMNTTREVPAIAAGIGDGAHPELVLALAQFALRRDDPARARALLAAGFGGQAVTLANADAQGSLALAEALAGQGAAGARRAAAVLLLDKTQPEALIAQARLALARGGGAGLDDALRDARLLLRDNPDRPDAYALLAAVYAAQGDAQLADRALDDGEAAIPASAEFLRLDARRLIATRALDQAMAVARNFTSRDPASPAGWAIRQQVCTLAGDTGCAQRALTIGRRLRGEAIPFPAPPADENRADQPMFEL